MTDIVVPFNNQPDSVAVKTSSYSIPSGSYARVTVYLRASNTCTATASPTASWDSGSISTTSGAENVTQSFWVPSGTALNLSYSNASTSTAISGIGFRTATGTTTASFTIGGTTALQCEAVGNVSIFSGANMSSGTLTVTGLSDGRYVVELYNELT